KLIDRMMSREPGDRPMDATDLISKLDALDRELDAPPPRPRYRRAVLMITLILGLAVSAFGGAWAVIASRSAPPPPEHMPVTAPPPPARVLAPADVLNCIGDDVTVEFVVGAVVRSGDHSYLFEKPPVAGSTDLTFRVAVSPELVAMMRKRGK